ncbi:transporter family-2 protein [Microcella putealis]|uniref:Transporter family-2 protein n=1 Tax=Microcella putealis TaxID=337005 RepID=A0A4Q7LG70_9MICO|nr:DMT family transporter [Microcella putealis]RZS53476.1 transporter family-2 protein [Microcella putealis]TQM26920.1 transporter family-2 protein [Microcella putealis]
MTAHAGRGRTLVAVAATVAAGVGVATQSRINGELGQRFDDGFTAALVSFSSGWVVLLLIVLGTARGRAAVARIPAAMRAGELPWWMLLGGAGGAFFVLSQGLVAGILGVAVFTVAIVSGQTLMGMVADARGFAGARRTPPTPARLAGAAMTVVAVGVAVVGDGAASIPWLALVLPLLAGLGIGIQQAMNGRVRQVSGSPLAATLVNFTVGTAGLVVVTAVHLAVSGLPAAPPSELYLYAGGIVGVVFIAVQAATVGRIGVLLLGMCLVLGQLLGAVVFDSVATLGPALAPQTVAAVVLTALGIVVASSGGWRRGHSQRETGPRGPAEPDTPADQK